MRTKTGVAYYDGAIHVVADLAELEPSLRHEYAHHVLVSNGVTGPMWFQEGTAMAFAHDCPIDAYKLWRKHPIDPKEMVAGFPHTASPEVANAFNAQACVTTEFLARLCLALEGCGTKELANAHWRPSNGRNALQLGDLAPRL